MTDPAVAVRDVSLRFGAVPVLDSVSLEVQPGETLGIVGPNGAGKTSLLNCISRIYPPTRGGIDVCGTSTDRLRPDQVAALGVARTFQIPSAFKDMTVQDQVLLGRHRLQRRGFAAYALGIVKFDGYERRQRALAAEMLTFVGLDPATRARVGDLGYGSAKLVDLARALASEPRVLLLDEPAAGLTGEERERMTRMLIRLRDQRSITQVVIEHDMALIKRVCDRLVVLGAGRKLAEGTPAAVLELPHVVEAFVGRPRNERRASTGIRERP